MKPKANKKAKASQSKRNIIEQGIYKRTSQPSSGTDICVGAPADRPELLDMRLNMPEANTTGAVLCNPVINDIAPTESQPEPLIVASIDIIDRTVNEDTKDKPVSTPYAPSVARTDAINTDELGQLGAGMEITTNMMGYPGDTNLSENSSHEGIERVEEMSKSFRVSNTITVPGDEIKNLDINEGPAESTTNIQIPCEREFTMPVAADSRDDFNSSVSSSAVKDINVASEVNMPQSLSGNASSEEKAAQSETEKYKVLSLAKSSGESFNMELVGHLLLISSNSLTSGTGQDYSNK